MLVLWTVTMAGAVLLVAAGLGHIVQRRHLAAILHTHRIPSLVRRVLVHGLGATEVVIGTAALSSFLVGRHTMLPVVILALVYTAFTGYLIRLLKVAPGASCGCFGGSEPAGPTTVARAAVLGTCAWLTLAASLPEVPTSRWAVVGAGVVVAVMVTTITGLISLRTAERPH